MWPHCSGHTRTSCQFPSCGVVSHFVGQQCCCKSLLSHLQKVTRDEFQIVYPFSRWALQAKIKEFEDDKEPVPQHMPKEVLVASFLLVFIPLLMIITIGNYNLTNDTDQKFDAKKCLVRQASLVPCFLILMIFQAQELGHLASLFQCIKVSKTTLNFSMIVG